MLRIYTFFTLFLSSAAFCYSSSCPMSIEGEGWICPGETTVLTAAAGFSEYYWSNGKKGQSIVVGPGSYRVVGRAEDGCVETAEFRVGEIKLPEASDLKILGASRVEGEQWVESRYAVSSYDERLDYFWMLDGDTISQGRELELAGRPAGAYQLRVAVFSSCTGQSVSTSVPLQPYEGNADSTIIYSCSPEPPYYYYSVPFSGPGLYDIISVNQVGFQIAVRRRLVIEPQYEESYDTVTLCGGAPLAYFGATISQPGSYDIPVRSFFGCQELVHLEALAPSGAPLYLEALTRCGPGGFEHNGEFYNMPGLYERAYPLANGCDSLAFTFVEYFDEAPSSEIFAEACPGDLYHHDGISYSEPGDYTRTYLLENGCDSVLTIHLSHPENLVRETNHYFCNGGSIEVNGVVFTESGTLEYMIPGQGATCDSLITAVVHELSPIEIDDQVLMPDDGNGTGSIALLLQGGSPPYAYEWSNGADTRDISQLAAGTYSLTVTDGLGCTASFTFDLGLLSGLANKEAGYRLTLGPNPFQDKLRVFEATNRDISNLAVYLYDPTGRLAVRVPFSGSFASVPSSLPQGLYWYRLESSGELLSAGKIVRQ
ncbi:MAG: T9SS type A sorting domain-containing protein [Lewinellaceae bacterium]|nr:T9SS type A sorting domain-containing protein [Phaeodactylibacter sp.]MCB9039885.1 T9SS type A sorting domain-containing protein [Lewinellaceae bacterium]